MIERQIESLTTAEQQMLEAASVAGAEFSVAALAAALGAEPDDVEDQCEALAWRGQFLRTSGLEDWPDGTIAGRYAFVHALYRNVLYERIAPRRLARTHLRIAEHKAEAWGSQVDEIAGELASHFEAAHDVPRAVAFHTRAGDLAVRRHADREAIAHFRSAQALLPGLRDQDQRAQCELEVLLKLAAPLMATAGYGAPEVEVVFDRAHAVARSTPTSTYRAPLLRGLVSFHQVRGWPCVAKNVGEELLALCGTGDPVARVQAHYGHGVTFFDLCELEGAEEHLRTALAEYDPATHSLHVSVYGGYDPGVACQAWLSWIRWYRGELDSALTVARAALAQAEQLAHPFTLVFACTGLATVHLHRGELDSAATLIERGRQIAEADGFHYQQAVLRGLLGSVRLGSGRALDAVALLEESVAIHERTGAGIALSGFLGALAVARLATGDLQGAAQACDAGLERAEGAGQVHHLPTLHRLRARLVVATGGADAAAEAWHRRGLAVAERCGAPILELESATGLAEHLVNTGRGNEARTLLGPILARFTEAKDTRPMQRSRNVLAQAS